MRIPQVLALALCLLGASALPAPEDTHGLAQRDDPSSGASLAVVPPEKSYEDPPERGLSLSRKDEKSTDISTRQAPTRNDYKQWGFLGIKTFLAANAAVKFYSLQKDCKEFDSDVGSAFLCIWNSIATIIGMGVLVHQAIEVKGHLGTRLRDNGWQVPGITKREETEELSGLLSSVLRTEVRHIGVWDSDGGDLSKRDAGEVVSSHVFGTKLAGRDVHFSYIGGDGNNASSTFRLGYGPGPESENNRVKRRGFVYNKTFFDKGGLDFTLDESTDNTDDEYLDPFDPKIFTWMVEQIGCYLQQFSFLQGLAMNANGLWFQLYDSKTHKTATRGSIAPYTEDHKSIIDQMPLDWIAGIESNDECTGGVEDQ
ncbi:hypothetical protein FQN55_003462 [Onygenales sp. PD_40]|nr:hypothetical protein FQN55_003462 [Onygenales sp. PD_40]KAK2783205.1 hypothetical protein FQN52_000419 [Onygenales sp. PD_12]KAK2784986.1 hypothetical protein FQN53_008037 [Emmonsiellopsis sp. PD_33]KAK2802872.1 hypothetical protein FQN51_004134 [Onygenales sp. PD_10]